MQKAVLLLLSVAASAMEVDIPDLMTMDQDTFDNLLDLYDAPIQTPAGLPVLSVQSEQDPLRQEGCQYSYNPSTYAMEHFDETKYLEIRAGEHFLYSFPDKQTAARGTFSIQSTAECVPQVLWIQGTQRKVVGQVYPDEGVFSLYLRRPEAQQFLKSYVGDWSITRTRKQFNGQVGLGVARVSKLDGGKVILHLPQVGTNGELCRYILEQMIITYYSPTPDKCEIGDTKTLI